MKKQQHIKTWHKNSSNDIFSSFLAILIRDGYTVEQVVPVDYQEGPFASGNTVNMISAVVVCSKPITE